LSEEDDFDIVPDEEEFAPRSTWFWVSIVAVVALFAFAVGIAFMVLSDRMGPASPVPNATADLAVTAPTQVAMITATVAVTSNAPITVSQTPTATAKVTATPSPTATPTCPLQVETLFVPLYDQARFGCPTGGAEITWAAFQAFERGSMLWRNDSDTSYVFYSSGDWFPITEGWDGGPSADRGAAPAGLQVPERGFGFVWSHDDTIFNGLGWARDKEKGFCALVQEFDHGFILQSSNVSSCTPENLYNFAAAGDWSPLLIAASDDKRWANVPSPTTPAEQGGQRPEAGLTRPAPYGMFQAINATGFTMDGNFDEWPSNWIPLNNIVYGAELHSGPGDLSGNFQVGWNSDGLMIAVRVNDDIYRAGPAGSDLWKGDGIEVQFDRELTEDFNTIIADADDYQVGITYDDKSSAIYSFLWLPLDRATDLSLPSAVTINQQGYQIEFLIPWYVLDILDAPSTDIAYGFNIAINDNDSEGNQQETILSASPARTTHNNPTQWGTLRLLP